MTETCPVPPPFNIAVTVIVYSVNSCKSRRVYCVALLAIPETVSESEKHDVSVFE